MITLVYMVTMLCRFAWPLYVVIGRGSSSWYQTCPEDALQQWCYGFCVTFLCVCSLQRRSGDFPDVAEFTAVLLLYVSSSLSCPKSFHASTMWFCLLVPREFFIGPCPPFQIHLAPLSYLFPTCLSGLHVPSILLHGLLLAISWPWNPFLLLCNVQLLILLDSAGMSPSPIGFLHITHLT